jgi:hypothetical protein
MLCLSLTANPQSKKSMNNQSDPKPRPGAPSTCGNDPVLPTDGTLVGEDFIPAGSAAYYTVNLKQGRSYAIDLWDPLDQTAGLTPQILVLANDCATPISITDVTKYDPDLSGGFAARVSWIQSSDSLNYIFVMNPDVNNGYSYNIRITDTTLYSPRWSTIAGFSTHYGFLNTTAFTIPGVLTLTSIQPQQSYNLQLNISSNNEIFVAIPSNNFNIPADQYGFATLAYVGPPGAITGDGYFQTVTNGIFSIAPTTFGPANRQH